MISRTDWNHLSALKMDISIPACLMRVTQTAILECGCALWTDDSDCSR